MPTYNRADLLRGALESLLCQEIGDDITYEIVVVDNASTDTTREVVEQIAANAALPVRYFYQAVPGDAPTRNFGVSQARGAWLAFVDDDELPAPDWLRELYRAAMQTGGPIVGGAVHLNLPQEVLDRLSPFVRTTSLREIDYYPSIRAYTGKHLPGTGNALVARHAIEVTGNFDASKVCGGSDSDFFLRARAAGLALYYTPHAVVRHRVSPNRLTTEYFRWDAQQGCSVFAGHDFKYKGRATLVLLCMARIAHAMLVVAPRLAWGWLRRDPREILGQKVRLWRAEGYARKTLAILAPAICSQQRYFSSLEFRRGRIVGQQSAAVEV